MKVVHFEMSCGSFNWYCNCTSYFMILFISG